MIGTIARDVTEWRALEQRLSRGERLESVGRLAGGVAHDFNSLLTAVIGHAELARGTLTAGDPVREDVEQVLASLVVNARDAMPSGSTVTISTANAVLDSACAWQHSGVVPGEYVVVTVTDTGVGMPDEVKEHLFEPFLTAKAMGRGTGLGLATAFGIVSQHKGHIWVSSEAGKGTTFKVYLPRAEEQADALPHDDSARQRPVASETILVAEGEHSVRRVTYRTLQSLGYNVLSATNGAEAVKPMEQDGRPICSSRTSSCLTWAAGS